MSTAYDDISSIDSSSCRQRKHTNDLISTQQAMIASLSTAVARLATTLQSKEEEMKARDRTESDLESRNLDLLIENAELKNQVADLKDGLSSNFGYQLTSPLTPLSVSDDEGAWSFHCDRSPEPLQLASNQFREWNEFRTSQDVAHQATVPRRKSMMNLSNLNLSNRFRNPLSVGVGGSKVSTAQSLFSSMKRKKIAWKDTRGFSPKIIPRHIYFEASLVAVSDEVSEVSVEDPTPGMIAMDRSSV